jgi:hypothetical protein
VRGQGVLGHGAGSESRHTKGHASWKELHRVDIVLVTTERLLALAITHIPELGCGVTRSRDKGLKDGRSEASGGNVR